MKRYVVILLHIGYWLMYFLLVASFLIVLSNGKMINDIPSIGRTLFFSPIAFFSVLPAVLGFYSFYFVLFNLFLHRRKILRLIVGGIITILICACISVFLFELMVSRNWTMTPGVREILGMITFLSLLAMINGIIGLVMRGFINWYGDIRVKEELQRKNYEVEIALLKSQLNPHFLFNTINNIDVLIEKDPEKASLYLNKLSDIMRFMLYETRSEKVPLSKELSYIEKYIELQRIRSSYPGYVHYELEGHTGSLMIEPMLLIPFIENAFKHAEYKKHTDAIRILIRVSTFELYFQCQNRFIAEAKINDQPGGLGNNLIRKRLSLLYPGKHHIDIKKEDGFYKVSLTLSMNEN